MKGHKGVCSYLHNSHFYKFFVTNNRTVIQNIQYRLIIVSSVVGYVRGAYCVVEKGTHKGIYGKVWSHVFVGSLNRSREDLPASTSSYEVASPQT